MNSTADTRVRWLTGLRGPVASEPPNHPRIHFADNVLQAISRLPGIHAFLASEGTAVVGWGRKRSGLRAQRRAGRLDIPFLLLEDGFLHSVERDGPPLSLVVDDLGIYYDATAPSRLERFISEPLMKGEAGRARALIEKWRKARISKYNHAREYEGPLPSRYVLLCDQARGDASLRHGRANAASFTRMLEAALAEKPDCRILIKLHPDVFLRRKRSHFNLEKLKAMPRVTVLAEDCHPVRLIEAAEAVYAVTSQMGFEALIHDKTVRTFGMPFYAGWGLTRDELAPPERRGKADLKQLVHAALVRYPRYIDPETGVACEVEQAMAHLALQRQMRSRFPSSVHALQFSRWKRPFVKRFLAGSDLRHVGDGRKIPPGATVALWGRDQPSGLPECTNVIHLEDGFLRSVGLGADLTQPLSWVCDDEGIHYDATRPSRLERILSETRFNKALTARAGTLRKTIMEAGLTKYNLSAGTWQRSRTDQRVILVPGQVEGDASIRYGAPGVKTNLDLLRVVRSANPDAYIVYKPHPDVVAGLRAGGEDTRAIELFCDEIAIDAGMATMLDQVDEVHTLTSLTGFEALLRCLPVTCHGQPFYAGWGLTSDIVPIARRTRRLALDELVAGCLILYPTYVSRVSGHFTTPERAVAELIAWRAAEKDRPALVRRAMRPAFAFADTFKRRRDRQQTAALSATGQATACEPFLPAAPPSSSLTVGSGGGGSSRSPETSNGSFASVDMEMRRGR